MLSDIHRWWAKLQFTDTARLRLYRKIATMDNKAPLPALKAQTPTWATAAALAKAWNLNRLAERLDALARSDG